MALDIQPTRSELINLKRRIKQTQNGYNLLKMKRDGLFYEFRLLLSEMIEAKRGLTSTYKAASNRIALASAIEGGLAVQSAALGNPVHPEVEVSSGEQFLKIQIVQAGFNIERITFESVNSSIDEPVILDQFMLGDPYPNPFNPIVMMDLTNHEPSEYTISIVNLKGEKVYHKSLGVLEPGNHSINWNGKNILGNLLPSGIYFLELSNSKFIENKKLILLR